MKKFKLNISKTYALKFINNIDTGEWCNVKNNKEYLEWVKEGNVADEPDPIPQPKPKKAKEKLEELGIDLKDLKKLLKDTPEE